MKTKSLEELFAEADQNFNGVYKKELNELTGLSKAEIDSVTPGTEDLKVYSVLVKVVEQASRNHDKQAKLVEDITKMGEIAIKIAKKIPSLAALFL